MAIQPIRPEQVPQIRRARLLDEVVAAFNELIARNIHRRQVTILQKEVVALIISKLQQRPDWSGKSAAQIEAELFRSNMLDVEDTFREAGWQVVYDKPGYNESYDAFFTFSFDEEC